MKRQFFNGIHYDLDELNRVVRLRPEFHNTLLTFDKWKGYKKIGGSSIPDVLVTDNFKSQFNAFCHISRIKLPVLQKKYINAGIAIEPKIFSWLEESLKHSKNDAQLFHYEAADYNYDYFQGKDRVFGGVPDGEIKYADSTKNMVVEAKTVGDKKFEFWNMQNENGQYINVPVAYRKQAQLYAHLMKLNRYVIVATFLSENEGDYINPDKYPIQKRNNRLYPFKVNPIEVEDDIKKVRDWYDHYTRSGVSPQYDPAIDADQVEFLKCKNQQEWDMLLEKWKKIGKADLDA